MTTQEKVKQALTEAVEEITGEVICDTDHNLLDTDEMINELDFLRIIMIVEEKLSVFLEDFELSYRENTPITELLTAIETAYNEQH